MPCSKSVTQARIMAVAALATYLLALLFHSTGAAPSDSLASGGQSTRNFAAFIGQPVEIPCDLKSPADSAKLIWIKWDRRNILTVDHYIITDDERISAIEKDGSWFLVIDNTTREDSGIYRCQINTASILFSAVNLLVKGCVKDEFDCGSSEQCIALNKRCDGLNHCVDGEDEENCMPEDCKGVNIYCGNGKCIPIQYFCDENDDCGNGFDETNCTRPLPVDCPAGEFPCGDGECISLRKHCDGRRDCENGADELPESCPQTTPSSSTQGNMTAAGCRVGYSSCRGPGDSMCVPTSWWCDGEVDCGNAADEKHCSAADCQAETTYCGNGVCTRGGRCDGKDDCKDNPGYDESDCSPSDCFPGARYCGNGRCVASHLFCDGIDQCGNGADEKFCDAATPRTPTSSAATPSLKGRGIEQPAREGEPAGPGGTTSKLEELVSSIARASNESLVLQRAIVAAVWRSCKLQYVRSNEALSEADHAFARTMGLFSCEVIDRNHPDPVNGKTVEARKRCDGRPDCPNGRDEVGCLEEMCGRDPTEA